MPLRAPILAILLTGCFPRDGRVPRGSDDTDTASAHTDSVDNPDTDGDTDADTADTDTAAVDTDIIDTDTGLLDEDGDGYDVDDCDDSNNAVHPGATELCNGIDDDCVGGADDGLVMGTYYVDDDADGVGGATSIDACTAPTGYAATTGDCDDTDQGVKPGVSETCSGVDNNCTGDENDATDAQTFHADADGDTFGDPSNTTKACTAPSGFVSNSTDCDDAKAAVHPGAAEACDAIDSDCNGKSELMHADTGDANSTAMNLGSTSSTYTICGASSACVDSSFANGDPDWIVVNAPVVGTVSATLTWGGSANLDVTLRDGGDILRSTGGTSTSMSPPDAATWTLPSPQTVYTRVACRAGTPGPWTLTLVVP